MKTIRQFIPYLIFCFTLFAMVRADDDEDSSILGELVVDLMFGVGMAICETSIMCSGIMTFIGVIVLLMMLCTCLCGSDSDRSDLWSSMPSGRRIAGTGAGYYATRRLIR